MVPILILQRGSDAAIEGRTVTGKADLFVDDFTTGGISCGGDAGGKKEGGEEPIHERRIRCWENKHSPHFWG